MGPFCHAGVSDSEEGMNVAIIGIGNLGRAVAGYFKGKRSKLNLVASFDNDPQKINKVISGVKCYAYDDLEKTIASKFSRAQARTRRS